MPIVPGVGEGWTLGDTVAAFGVGGAHVVGEGEIAPVDAHEDVGDGAGGHFGELEGFAVVGVAPADGRHDVEHVVEVLGAYFERWLNVRRLKSLLRLDVGQHKEG